MTGLGCERFREAISAAQDGEDPGLSAEFVEAHLSQCERCREYRHLIHQHHRDIRIRRPDPVPDLSARIVEHLADLPPARHRRRPSTAMLSGLVAASVAVCMGWAGGRLLAGDHAGKPRPAAVNVYETDARFPGALVYPSGSPVIRKPTVTMDDAGHPYDVATATKDQVTLLYFGYTHCPDLCPIEMELTGQALRLLPARLRTKVDVVFITTDPRRDTPAVMQAWLSHFDQGTKPFVGLTSSISTIHDAERQVNMPLSYAAKAPRADGGYRIVHSGYVLIYSSDGTAHMQVDDTETPAGYARTLESLLK